MSKPPRWVMYLLQLNNICWWGLHYSRLRIFRKYKQLRNRSLETDLDYSQYLKLSNLKQEADEAITFKTWFKIIARTGKLQLVITLSYYLTIPSNCYHTIHAIALYWVDFITYLKPVPNRPTGRQILSRIELLQCDPIRL